MYTGELMADDHCTSTLKKIEEQKDTHTHCRLTCGDEEDSRTEDDVVSAPVKLTGGHTEPPQEQQTHTHDGEDTGGTHSTCTHTHTKKSGNTFTTERYKHFLVCKDR